MYPKMYHHLLFLALILLVPRSLSWTLSSSKPSPFSPLPSRSTRLHASALLTGACPTLGYTFDETPNSFTLTLDSTHETSSSITLLKLLPQSIKFDSSTGLVSNPDEVIDFKPPPGFTDTQKRNYYILLNANGGVKLETPKQTLTGVFRSKIDWETLFWSYESPSVSLEFEKIDLFSEWERKNLGSGFKDWVEEGGNEEGEDELENMVNELEGDVLYEESEYWRTPFLLHEINVIKDPGMEEGTINVEEYVEELMGGKEIDMDKVEKDMFNTGISQEMEDEGKREGN